MIDDFMKKKLLEIGSNLRAKGVYLCGPFLEDGQPSSPDIHLLVITPGSDVTDLHYLPGICDVGRRIEVSTVGYDLLARELCQGVKTQLVFYTYEKMRTAKTLAEDADCSSLRARLPEARIRPSLVASITRNLAVAKETTTKNIQPADALLKATTLFLAALSAWVALGARRGFMKISDMIEGAVGDVRGAFAFETMPADHDASESRLALCRSMIGHMLKAWGIDPDRLHGQAMGGVCNRFERM